MYWSQYGWDKQQDRDISELQNQLTGLQYAARSSTSRLQSELSKVSGSLEQRLSRLASAFDAFVELSDLRMTLTLFDAHARVRHRARQLFGEHPLPGELSDVDGYWLAPALSALHALTDGAAAPEPALALARSRDPHRAALFHVLGAALLGRPETVTPAMVADALPELDTTPLLYQRAVWLLAADGLLDAGAREHVLLLGRARLDTLDDKERAASVTAWRSAVRPDPPVAVPRALGQATGLITALDGAERLTVLRHWVAAGLEQGDKPAGEVDSTARHALQLLVDEGSPLELPLLTRERELRKVIESNGATAKATAPDGWETPVEPLVALLRADVVDETHPGRRALGIRMSATHILAAAEGLAEQARTAPPEQVEARVAGYPVLVSQSGPDEASLERAIRRRLDPHGTHRRRVAYGALGAAVAFLLFILAIGWVALVPALAALGVAGYQLHRERTEKAEARQRETDLRASVRAEADRCVADYIKFCQDLTLAQTHLDDDLAALRALLDR
ncbi:hypothetical protein [Actinophytocola sp.]|uniref:hypothetical protein n=1 Tax=Actinophytocola sp. TaxID=1872138 RepID=UPI002D80D47D|nr:hypothetical protein [Actinophytocola sp.]HET9143049.1 hypothetical protein [Actinophytocola sp.]